MNKAKLYATPFIVAWVMLIIGLLGAFNLAYIPLFIEDYDGMSGGYAFMVIGIFVAIAAVIIFVVYGKLNNEFKRMLAGDVLLSFILPYDIFKFFCRKEADNVRGGNIMALLMILFFCILFGSILGFSADAVFFVIFIGIAVFFTAIYFITTAFRTKKIKKSQALVCLSLGGAYIFGQLHSWSIAGSRPIAADFVEDAPDSPPCPCIQVTYLAASYPVPRQQTVTIPVPAQMADRAAWAVYTIKNAYGI